MEEKNNNNVLKRLKDGFYNGLDIPADLINGFTAEIRGRGEAYICGCKRISEFTENIIRLEMKNFVLVIRGDGLQCPGFCGVKISVAGNIKSITFEEAGDDDGFSC
ncbi:MAG: YabP/YqfC family sporulation protein [Clostridia bacterium]|nr:YabP/YqfC family sporulation protein [Clostridia bacterium]